MSGKTWQVVVSQKALRGWYGGRRASFAVTVSHCVTVGQAVRVAQRAYPGWTAVYAEFTDRPRPESELDEFVGPVAL